MTRISDSIYALIDSERSAADEPLSEGRQVFVKTCQRLGIAVHALERRATENYLSERAVKSVKGVNYRELTPFEKLEDVTPSWGKHENWRIAREMNPDDLRDTDLGDFIDRLSR